MACCPRPPAERSGLTTLNDRQHRRAALGARTPAMGGTFDAARQHCFWRRGGGGLCAALVASAAPAARNGFDTEIDRYAETMLEQGPEDLSLRHLRQRGVLGRHAAAAQGDRGRRRTAASAPAFRPKTALAVGLKVDADALPAALKKQLKAGKVDLDDPATTLALLKLNAVVGVTALAQPRRRRQVDGHPVRAVPFDRRRFVCARHRQAAGRLGQPRPQRRRDRRRSRRTSSRSRICSASTTATVKKVLASWGPGRFDAELRQGRQGVAS